MNMSMVKKYNNFPIGYDPKRVHFGKLTLNRDILGLFKVIFARDFDSDLIEWYAACPTGSNIWYGAFEGSEPVGMYGLLPIKIKVGNQVYNGALCNNVGVMPKYFGRGLFQSLSRYALEDAGFPVSVCQPNVQASRGHKVVGWECCGILELLSSDLEEREIDFVEYDQFQFIPRENEPYFCIVKDSDFFKWRYSRPYMQYFQSFFDDGRYAIWKYYGNRKQVCEITDFQFVHQLGGKIDILQFKDSTTSKNLKDVGFHPTLTSEFLVTGHVEIKQNVNEFNFEPGDNDVF